MRLPHSYVFAGCLLTAWSVACSSKDEAADHSPGASRTAGNAASSSGAGAATSGAPTGGAAAASGARGGASPTGGSSSSGESSGGESSAGESANGGSANAVSADAGTSNGGRPSGGSSSGGASAGSTGTVYPPGPPGCGLEQAAFCETFDAPSSAPTRAGELDGSRFSAARMCNIGGPSSNDEAVAIGSARLPACRGGLPEQVFPSQDALICDGTDAIQSNHLLVLVAAQNYGQNSYRIRQPFDFAGRTGKIVFDGEGYNVGLLGWISLEVTEDPTPAPSFTLQQNFENGSIPRNGFEVQFSHNCGGDHVGIGAFLVYDDFKQTLFLENEGDCATAAAGKLNHFEIDIATDHVDVYATPASDNGKDFGERVQLASVDVELPFSRGYVHLTTHNHATLKYSDDMVDAWQARWDNVGFDGPAILGAFREYEALDSLSSTEDGKVNVGWRVADAAEGPAQQIEIPGVNLEAAKSAQIALQNWALHFAGDTPPADYALNYRVNGHDWKQRLLTSSELQMMADLPNAGTRSLLLDVDLGELVTGKNTLELTTSNVSTGYPPVALNIDLILRTE